MEPTIEQEPTIEELEYQFQAFAHEIEEDYISLQSTVHDLKELQDRETLEYLQERLDHLMVIAKRLGKLDDSIREREAKQLTDK